jgi:hypothetical protein
MDWNDENESKKQRAWEREKNPNIGILVKNERTKKKEKEKAEKKRIEKEEYSVNYIEDNSMKMSVLSSL